MAMFNGIIEVDVRDFVHIEPFMLFIPGNINESGRS